MIFDKIIMNPPYSRNLHLKVLEKAIKYLKDDNSVCVNLSPTRWLQDPLAKYKKNSDYNKFEKSIAQHIESLDTIDSAISSEMFKACFTFGMGIYTINKKTFPCPLETCSILEKIIASSKVGVPLSKVEDVKKEVFSLVTTLDGGHRERVNSKGSTFDFIRNEKWYGKYYVNGISTNGRTLEENKTLNKLSTNGKISTWACVEFDSSVEAENFYNLTKTKFYKYVYKTEMVDVSVHPRFLPWLGDVENPRTHKIGYESDWTNEDLCKVFNITGFISDTEAEAGSEWEEILKT